MGNGGNLASEPEKRKERTNQTGTPPRLSREDSSGLDTGSTGSSYSFAATSGYRTDGDAGLMKVGCRYYDSQTGTFTSRDTYLDQKPYLYCEHEPVNAVDPSGHVSLKQIAETVKGPIGAVTVVGVIGTIVKDNTPKGTPLYRLGSTAEAGGIALGGIGLIAAGAIATAPVAIVALTVAGTYIACEGVWMALTSWTDD